MKEGRKTEVIKKNVKKRIVIGIRENRLTIFAFSFCFGNCSIFQTNENIVLEMKKKITDDVHKYSYYLRLKTSVNILLVLNTTTGFDLMHK